MQTRSGIPLDEIAPDAPDLRAVVAAVLANAHTYSDSRVGTVPKELIHALRAAYEATPKTPVTPSLWRASRDVVKLGTTFARGSDFWSAFDVLAAVIDATPEPAPAITAEERQSLRRARTVLILWADLRGVDSPDYQADLAVLARLAGRT